MTDYIRVPRWQGKDGFQHYRNREPIWIKNYTRLLSSDAYLVLSFAQRGLLHGIWLEYARSSQLLPSDPGKLSQRLGQKVRKDTLDSLIQAGFIQIVASAALAKQGSFASTEVEKRRELPVPAPTAEANYAPSGDIDFDSDGDGAGAGAGDFKRLDPHALLERIRPA